MENTNQKILDINEVAVYLHSSTQTIRKLIRENIIPSFRVGRRIYVSKDSLETWIKNQEMQVVKNKDSETEVKNIKE